jgi:tetratricopeptide (TPR) repeat protein
VTEPYEVLRLDELDRISVDEGLEWRPIRRRLGIGAFGVNAYTSERVGGWVVEEHVEGSGHQELYLVVSGRARFTLDGEDVDAPAGTIVYLRDHRVRRKAVAEENGTTVLAIGGWPDRAFEPSPWEWWFEAYAQAPERGIEIMREALAESGERPPLLYHLACIEAKAGRRDDATEHLGRAIELDPSFAARAREDEDLIGIADGASPAS